MGKDAAKGIAAMDVKGSSRPTRAERASKPSPTRSAKAPRKAPAQPEPERFIKQTIYLSEAADVALKTIAAQTGRKQHSLMIEGINALLKRHGADARAVDRQAPKPKRR